ncbi:MAG: threonine synthase [Clostridia bacterium]|nr:threonine synthase [Clostridia bacterium]
MTYKSTRGAAKGISFSEAVLKGIAPDGGLFVPEQDVRFDSLELAEMCGMDYKTLAAHIFKRYAGDFTDAEIEYCVDRAYGSGSRFDAEDPAPVRQLSRNLSVMELWHGPTAAFKDMALQALPAFMSVALKKRRRTENVSAAADAQGAEGGSQSRTSDTKIAILTATSGDTGKAAMEGFKDAPGIDIMVFFPENGVSEMQSRQMQTQEGGNIRVVAVRGNFDDAQTGVKRIFGDDTFRDAILREGWQLSSANSINFGRLLPQIVYYFHAYFSLVRSESINLGAPVNFVVPTGNFGDILAAYYAYKNGLPVGRLICAANSNSVVADFINTGYYNANREFKVTISPAMDILISSNLERLIYDMSGEDEKTTAKLMMDLRTNGSYNVDRAVLSGITSLFWADKASEDETRSTISDYWKQYRYLVDPHTAVGLNVYDKYVISSGDLTPTVAVSTASPFKFNRSVAEAVFSSTNGYGSLPDGAAPDTDNISEFTLLTLLSETTGCPIPAPLQGLNKKPLLHTGVCDKDKMEDEVLSFLRREVQSAK